VARFSFDRGLRLLSAADFGLVFAGTCKSIDQWLVVMARPNRRGRARLGIAASKKHVRLSVDRNRIKRLVRESFRQSQERLAGLDLVVIARAGVAGQTNSSIHESLDRHWSRVISKCKES